MMHAENPDPVPIIINPLSVQSPAPTPRKHINKTLTALQITHNVQNTTQPSSVHYPPLCMHSACLSPLMHKCMPFFGGNMNPQRHNTRTTTTTQHGAVQRTTDCVECQLSHACGSRRRCSERITYRTLGRPPIRRLKELPNAPNQGWRWWWWWWWWWWWCASITTLPLHPDKDNGVMPALACYVTHQICTWSKMKRYPWQNTPSSGWFGKGPSETPRDCQAGVSGERDPFNNCHL